LAAPYPALIVDGAQAVVLNTSPTGQATQFGAFTASGLFLLNGARVELGGGQLRGIAAPGIYGLGGALTVRGDALTVIEAFGGAASALFRGSNITLDPSVTLRPSGGRPDIMTTGAVIRRRLAALTATGALPYGSIVADLYSRAGDLVAIYGSAPAVAIPFLGTTLWLDPTSVVLLVSAVLGSNERLRFTLPVPGNAGLSGTTLAMQALIVNGTEISLSNLALVSVR
jgi:hypothetical protein